VLLAAGAAAAGGLAAAAGACAPGGAPEGAPVATRPQPVEIRFHARTGPQGDYFREWGERYTAERRPHVTVVQEQFPGGEYHEKLTALIAAGTLGDALWGSSLQTYGLLVRANVLRDHAPLARQARLDWSVFFPQTVQGATRAGRIDGVPHAVHQGRAAFFLSTAALQRAGLNVPADAWTVPDFVQTAQRLTAAGADAAAFGALPNTSLWGAVCWIRSFGGDYLSPDGRRLTIDTPAALQALQFLADCFGRFQVAPPGGSVAGTTNVNQAIALGRLGMLQEGYWGGNNIRREADDAAFTAVPLPHGPAGSGSMVEFNLDSVTTLSRHPEEAFGYCAYMSEDGPAVASALTANSPGARRSAWEHPTLTGRSGHAAFARTLPTAPPLLLPANGRGADLEAEWEKLVGSALRRGEGTSARALVDQVLPALRALVET
jgi:ABC-type glycerol-3-phosphate transport system substrate-binding protein